MCWKSFKFPPAIDFISVDFPAPLGPTKPYLRPILTGMVFDEQYTSTVCQ